MATHEKRRIRVNFTEGRIALLHMQSGENKFTPEFVGEFDNALNDVEQ